MSNSTLNNNGNKTQRQGGAIEIINSQLSVINSTFINNTAMSGGAISFEWTNLSNWDLQINNSIFSLNTAVLQGGAIYYSYKRPIFSQITYDNNKAQYGNDIASYAVKIRFAKVDSDKMKLTNMASGIKFKNDINFELVDADNQVMVLNSINQIALTPVSNSTKIAGINVALLKNGIATLSGLTVITKPGSANVMISTNCLAIDDSKIRQIYGQKLSSNLISIDFRYWMPGEIQMSDNSWLVWQAGTYSFNWNSTECILCPPSTECPGGEQFSLNPGYWRENTNETYLVEWLFKAACNGGYFPLNQYPVECSEGYRGLLWNECQITNDTKFQKVSDYQCEKWPNAIYNGIRVVGVMILVFIFLMVIVIINIKKTKESEMSILLRIFTNYIK